MLPTARSAAPLPGPPALPPPGLAPDAIAADRAVPCPYPAPPSPPSGTLSSLETLGGRPPSPAQAGIRPPAEELLAPADARSFRARIGGMKPAEALAELRQLLQAGVQPSDEQLFILLGELPLDQKNWKQFGSVAALLAPCAAPAFARHEEARPAATGMHQDTPLARAAALRVFRYLSCIPLDDAWTWLNAVRPVCSRYYWSPSLTTSSRAHVDGIPRNLRQHRMLLMTLGNCRRLTDQQLMDECLGCIAAGIDWHRGQLHHHGLTENQRILDVCAALAPGAGANAVYRSVMRLGGWSGPGELFREPGQRQADLLRVARLLCVLDPHSEVPYSVAECQRRRAERDASFDSLARWSVQERAAREEGRAAPHPPPAATLWPGQSQGTRIAVAGGLGAADTLRLCGPLMQEFAAGRTEDCLRMELDHTDSHTVVRVKALARTHGLLPWRTSDGVLVFIRADEAARFEAPPSGRPRRRAGRKRLSR